MLSLRLSNFMTPAKLSESAIRLVLIVKSRGESALSEGERLISSSHGLRSESRRMSNPNNSNQFVRCEQFLFIPFRTGCSPVISAFMITSKILDHNKFMSIPICSRCLQSAVMDHLNPKSSLSVSSLALQFKFLFIYRVVSQMDVLVLLWYWGRVFFSREPSQSFFIDVHSQRVERCHEDIDS